MISSQVPETAWTFELSPLDGKWWGAFAHGLVGDNGVGAPKYKVRIFTRLHDTLEGAEDELTVLTAGIPEAQRGLE